MSRAIEVVVFDLDDTLYLERDYVRSGFRAVDARLTGEGIHGFFEVAWGAFERGVRGKIFDHALEDLGVAADAGRIAALVDVYREHQPTLTLLEDAAWALDQLRAAGRRLALVTDGYLEVQRRKSLALTLPGRLDSMIYSDALGRAHWKPSRVPFEAVMNALGCTGECCVYVGDNPGKDFEGPHALGWATVRVIRDGGEHASAPDNPASPAQHTVRSLRELANVLELPDTRSTPPMLDPSRE